MGNKRGVNQTILDENELPEFLKVGGKNNDNLTSKCSYHGLEKELIQELFSYLMLISKNPFADSITYF
jgi:hypothetical protein